MSTPKPCRCDICDLDFTSKKARNRHELTAEHIEREVLRSAIIPIRCGVCDLNFPTRRAHKKHDLSPQHKSARVTRAALRSGNPTFRCNVCDFTFGTRQARKNHYSTPTHQKAEIAQLASRTSIPVANWHSGLPLSSLPRGFQSNPERTCLPCQLTFHNIIVYRKHIATSSCHTRHAAPPPNPPSTGQSYSGALQAFILICTADTVKT